MFEISSCYLLGKCHCFSQLSNHVRRSEIDVMTMSCF
jgi:hypothetical protein